MQLALHSMLHILICFTFFNVLLDKSTCFGTLELHFVQLIVVPFHLTALTDLILYYYLKFIVLSIKFDRMICFAGSSYFLHIS